jgi:hypothetical protein
MDPNRDGDESNPRNIFWPPVDTPEQARYVARHGFWATVANAFLPLAYLAAVHGFGLQPAQGLDSAGVTNWALAELIVTVPIAVGQFLFSRIAALIAPAAFVAGKILLLSYYQGDVQIGGLLVAAFWLVFYVQGIRGTFALHQMRG